MPFQEECFEVEESRAERWGHRGVRCCIEFFDCLPIPSDLPEEICSRVMEFCDEHCRAVVRHSELHGLGGSVEGCVHRILLASQMCELSQESRLSFCSVLGESREEVVGFEPALFCLVEPAEF